MSVERIDKYTVRVNGTHVTADPEQEEALRRMSPEDLERFVAVVGGTEAGETDVR